MAKPLRVCPTFKLYWVENCKVATIKRHDYNMPFTTPADVVSVIKEVYPLFDYNKHAIKYRDADELIDFSKTDKLSFQFNENFTTVSFYIFTSSLDASNFVPTWTHEAQRSRGFHRSTPDFKKRPADVFNKSASILELSHSESPIVHPNATCCGCQFPISSDRYICLECTNYDICASCEKRDQHPGHLMVRIPISFYHAQGALYHSVLAGIVSSAKKNIPHTID